MTTTTTSTTSTTTLHPLASVITDFYKILNGKIIEFQSISASDDNQTIKTPFTKASNFGTIATGEISQTIIIGLSVPSLSNIRNIKIGLIDTGEIEFTTKTFGISTSPELRTDITPSFYFQGINLEKEELYMHNISINNRTDISSYYVYLNVALPIDHTMGAGVIKFKWFFDYAD